MDVEYGVVTSVDDAKESSEHNSSPTPTAELTLVNRKLTIPSTIPVYTEPVRR